MPKTQRRFRVVKICGDKECPRLGQKLPAKDFPRNRERPDGRCLYCRECATRRVNAYRTAKRAEKAKKKALVPPVVIERKPIVIAKVRTAIAQGLRTREQIQHGTNLNYDEIGDALAELVYDHKAVRIQNRQFVIAA